MRVRGGGTVFDTLTRGSVVGRGGETLFRSGGSGVRYSTEPGGMAKVTLES
jgi:hypothetical protein